MEKEEKKKKKKKRHLKFHIKLIIFIILLVVYAFLIGPKGIFIKDYNIKTNKLSNNYDGLKILQFSDLYYGSTVTKKDVKNLVKKINSANADVVIFTGNLISDDKIDDNGVISFLKKELSKINADYGKYFVLGDDDTNDSLNILNSAGFTDVDKSEEIIYKDNKTPILLISQNCKSYFEENDTNMYKILIINNPDNFDNVKKYDFDIVLSGNNLNGLINIYKLKDLLIESKYKNAYQKIGNTKMYINAGIGTRNIKVRLFNHPTINLYRFETKTK